VPDVLASLTPVGTEVPTGLEAACALPGVRAFTSPTDSEITLLVPADDEPDPEVTLLVPAVNERITIEEFVSWCHEGLATAGVRGEILIVDASSDDTPELALRGGARVLHTPLRGLGRAYIDAIPHVRGKYVIMGDADCTYDFRKLAPFVEAMRNGTEYAMGSRWKGSIERGAMPPLHQYFGTPFTTWILNRLYGSQFSDIHCGMRGITRDALVRMGIASQSWEYASEMVLKSVRMELVTTEVPVTFLKDQEGRLSHHKRSGWFSPFAAAWINLRAMFVNGAEFFLFKPGIILTVLGLLLSLPLSFGDITVGRVTFSLLTMLVGVTLVVIGLQSIYFGGLAHMFLDYGGRLRERWRRIFTYTKMMVISGLLFTVGLLLDVVLLVTFIRRDFALPDPSTTIPHLGVLGLMLMMVGFSTFCFTLLLHATSVSYGASQTSDPRVD
jgi:glycosyltransferase involved in cell wall biosynthesis